MSENLQSLQLEIQKSEVIKLQEKLSGSSYSKNQTTDRVFKLKYLNNIENAILEIKRENLQPTIEYILKKENLIDLLKSNLSDFKEFKDYDKLKKILDSNEEIKEYFLEDIADYLASKLIDSIENSTKKSQLLEVIYENAVAMLYDLDESIESIELKQKKQFFALFTLPLTSKEVAYCGFIPLTKLLLNLSDKEDKVNPASEQLIVLDMAESIYETLQTKIKRTILEPDNDTLIKIASELFILFESSYIIETNKDAEDDRNLDIYKLTDTFLKDAKDAFDKFVEFANPIFKPMVVKPLEWTTVDSGGFLRGESVSSKYHLLIQKCKTKRETKEFLNNRANFPKEILEAINIIQNTKWQIDTRVLKVAKEHIDSELKRNKQLLKDLKLKHSSDIKNIDKEIENLQKDKINLEGQIDIVKKLNSQESDKLLSEIEDKKREINKTISQFIKAKNSFFKDTLETIEEYKIEEKIALIADEFKDFEEIYFVWQMDFRGRLYPVQAFLNPQGQDLAKALLRFAEKKPLGENGEFWLKVHGANCYGVDKVSFDDRVKWVEENSDNIVAVANASNPFNEPFLLDAEDKYKFLAFCYEWAEYKKDPINFKSSLPIAIDGSNNGFQHISALLRDINGAKKVNVLPNDDDKPADIYNEVAAKFKELLEDENIVNEELQKVAKKEEIQQEILKDLKTLLTKVKIDRKLVKKGVMTDSYGAGEKTKANQLRDELISRNININEYQSTLLFAKILNRAISEIAPSSKLYKDWINKLAKLISKQKKPIIWHTPILNFRVIQQEYKYKEIRVVTKYKGKTNNIQIRKYTNEIDPKEQIIGMAPNFIHSLDATHLYLTILNAYSKGVDAFATVHDSFATHACDVDTLTQYLKDEFKKLFKYDVLKHLQEEMQKEYNITIVKEKPSKDELKDITLEYVDDSFDIELIDKAKYFFA